MFDEQEFLEVAKHLQQIGGREGFRRSAISRAYYSVFLFARREFRTRGWVPSTGGGSDHRAVADALSNLDDALAVEYRNLRRLRNLADYSVDSLDPATLVDQVQYAIDVATLIRAELERRT